MQKSLNKGSRAAWEACFAPPVTPRQLVERIKRLFYKQARQDVHKRTRAVPKDDGPMGFLAVQIIKKMEQAGWPSKVHKLYRSPEEQAEVFVRGASKARPWQSPHQFLEAADIVHASLYWQAPPEFWEALATAVRVVSAEYSVDLEHGHHWKFVDSAHVELKDWRKVRDAQINEKGFNYKPLPSELKARFDEVLPQLKREKSMTNEELFEQVSFQMNERFNS